MNKTEKLIRSIVQYHNCEIINEQDLMNCSFSNNDTKIHFKCNTCGNISSKITKNLLYSNPSRKTFRGLCTTCGRKQWTNKKINESLKNRSIVLLTDVDYISQPSVTPIQWECNICDYNWFARVDNIIGKQSGCPKCAGNLSYTLESLSKKLSHRDDIEVLEIYKGTANESRRGLFRCNKGHIWKTRLQTVVTWECGCPMCNGNISKPIVIDGHKFHSRLESYFWKQFNKQHQNIDLELQKRYSPDRRLTCDFYLPTKKLWIEISGLYLLKQKKYSTTIDEKRQIVSELNEQFVILSTIGEINKFIKEKL